jgi:hypothetical protein
MGQFYGKVTARNCWTVVAFFSLVTSAFAATGQRTCRTVLAARTGQHLSLPKSVDQPDHTNSDRGGSRPASGLPQHLGLFSFEPSL